MYEVKDITVTSIYELMLQCCQYFVLLKACMYKSSGDILIILIF